METIEVTLQILRLSLQTRLESIRVVAYNNKRSLNSMNSNRCCNKNILSAKTIVKSIKMVQNQPTINLTAEQTNHLTINKLNNPLEALHLMLQRKRKKINIGIQSAKAIITLALFNFYKRLKIK